MKGFTARHPAVPPADQGTYAGLAHPDVIACLQELGITAVELSPVHQSITNGPLAGERLTNFWGYDTIVFRNLTSLRTGTKASITVGPRSMVIATG